MVDFIEQFTAMIAGFIIAISVNWKLTLILFPLVIVVIITTIIILKVCKFKMFEYLLASLPPPKFPVMVLLHLK